MSRRSSFDEPLKHEAWAVPYADLMTLMLAFFVVLYAVSKVHPRSAETPPSPPVSTLALAPIPLNPPPALRVAPLILKMTVPAWTVPKASSAVAARPTMVPVPPPAALDQIQDRIAQALAPLVRQQQVTLQRDPRWLKIELQSDVLFPSGVAELSPEARVILNRIAAILRPFPNPLRVEGYADDQPIHTAAFPSNWELSAARAGSVARLFSEQGLDPDRLGIMGWGDSKPVVPNTTLQGRHRNRRVLLVVLSDTSVTPASPTPDAAATGRTGP